MKILKYGFSATVMMLAMATAAHGQAVLTSTNGKAKIGINRTGELATSGTGLSYNFTGQGGLTGYRDAITPGCACEAWGVAANGVGGQVGQTTGNQRISFVSSNLSGGTYTSVTALSGVAGLSISQAYSLSNETTTGALFANTITLRNNTSTAMTDVRYARAMDWDVPPSEFDEYSTFVGTGTTTSLLRSTDDGFANANPLTAVFNNGRSATPNTDGSFGPDDHGALFVFGFGDLAANSEISFKIYYGAGENEADALALLGAVGPELYNFGQSTRSGARATDLPTYIFGFSGVGGSVVVPPVSPVPEPTTWAMMLLGFSMVAGAARYRRRKANVTYA